MNDTKKVFILVGHPDGESLSNTMADAYETGSLSAGREVRRQNLYEMKFDPILHRGYKAIQELEPDLKTFQENVKWCDHLVVVYPNWWCTMPALLKGLFDRAWLPGFAFRFRKNDLYGWEKLLKGKSARIIILADIPEALTWFLFGEFTNELARATLGFAGIHPVNITVFSPSERCTPDLRLRWIQKVKTLGARGR